jgi:RNA polymerase-binding transcription factor DksA
MPVPLYTASLWKEQVTDERRACWITQLLEGRSFRRSQIESLDLELNGVRDDPADAVISILRAGSAAVLQQIDDALFRLASGQFGRCVICNQPIELERLDVLPMTSRCMPCQYDAEVGGG